MAKHVNKGIPLAKSPQASKVEKGKKILDQVKEFKVPTNVKIRVHKTVTPDGATFPIIHADVKTTAVKDLGIVKMAGKWNNDGKYDRIRGYKGRELSNYDNKYLIDPRLVVEMNFKGKGKSGTNACWLGEKCEKVF
nr:hypothetical protein [Bacillus velezensis]